MFQLSPGRQTTAFRRLLETFVLWSFAVAQPLFDLIARGPTFLVAHGVVGLPLVLGVFLFAVAVPAALRIPAELMRALGWTGAAVVLGRASNTLLGALLAAQLFLRLPWAMSLGVTAVSALTAGLLLSGWFSSENGRRVIAVLAPACLFFPVVFLLHGSVSPLVSRARLVPREPVPVGKPAPVVLVVFDEFSLAGILDDTDRIDPSRFPNLAALAGEATWFRNATTVHVWTEAAVPAILTGRRPPETVSSPTAQAFPENLFTLLAGSLRLSVFETLTRLCPSELCFGPASERATIALDQLGRDLGVVYLHVVSPRSLRARLSPIDSSWAGFGEPNGAPRTRSPAVDSKIEPPELFGQFLSAIATSPEPALHFIHVSLPHIPYRYLPSGVEYVGDYLPHGLVDGTWNDDEWESIQAQQRYLLQLGEVDRLVGQLRSALVDRALYDGTLLIVTADHGVSFRPGDSRRVLSAANVGAILPIPLLIKRPGQREGEIRDDNAEVIDILPTIASVLAIGLPWKVDGRSLFDPFAAPRPAKLAYSGSEWRSFPAELRERATERSLIAARFGRGPGFESIFAIGGRSPLLGTSIEAFLRAPYGSFEAALDFPIQFTTVDPRSGFVPCQIAGSLVGGLPEDDFDIAVAVDGIVRAVTRPYGPLRDRRFAAMVPEASFIAGSNRIDLFQLGRPGEPGAARRIRITQRARPWVTAAEAPYGRSRLLPSASVAPRLLGMGLFDDLELEDGAQKRQIVDNTATWGFLEQVDRERKLVAVSGWAGSPELARVADHVLLFLGSTYLGDASPDRDRDDVTALYGAALARSGFRAKVPIPEHADESEPIRAIALIGDSKAGELRPVAGPSTPMLRAGVLDLSLTAGDEPGRKALHGPGQPKVEVSSAPYSGRVDRIEHRDGSLVVSGWAADLNAGVPARRVLIFVRSRCVAMGTTGVRRVDVAGLLGVPSLLDSGFEVPVLWTDPIPDRSDIHVVAVLADRRAVELELHASTSQ